MKYKLIKTYPGYDDLNRIVWFSENNLVHPEKYPEFWEEVAEEQYKVLVFYNEDNNQLYYADGSYCYNKNFQGRFVDTGSRSLEYCKEHYKIHSIRRLSDKEVFTVGDRINGNILEAIFPSPLNENDIVLSCKNILIALYLIEDSHIKVDKNLFTTEDGVDIFEGDTYSFVWLANPAINQKIYEVYTINNAHLEEGTSWSESTKHFSTKEKAEEYIVMNKPCLSVNDIMSIDYDLRGKQSLVNLVKTKLK